MAQGQCQDRENVSAQSAERVKEEAVLKTLAQVVYEIEKTDVTVAIEFFVPQCEKLPINQTKVIGCYEKMCTLF